MFAGREIVTMPVLHREIKRYGWIPDMPDHRDFLYAAPVRFVELLPARVDLRPQCPKIVYDQGEIGSCTGNAIAAAMEFDQIKQKLPAATPSRLFIYYNERAIEGNIQTDAGAQIRDGIKTVASQGACPEKLWPYRIDKFATRPTKAAYASAARHKVVLYQRVNQSLDSLKASLANGYPIVFGFTVYESFESDAVAQTGILPMPEPHEKTVGGHAVLIVGYDDATEQFTARNSWGSAWGNGGYFFMPYAYVNDPNLAGDFWTIRTVQS
jgi:C1A family cysteine protease